MASYKIELVVEEANIKTVEKKLREHFGAAAAKSARKIERRTSRADRLAEAESSVSEAASEVESLKDELQEWYDNLPENFQQGDKGSELEEAISQLGELQDALEAVDFSFVSFPGMY